MKILKSNLLYTNVYKLTSLFITFNKYYNGSKTNIKISLSYSTLNSNSNENRIITSINELRLNNKDKKTTLPNNGKLVKEFLKTYPNTKFCRDSESFYMYENLI
jgi:hypothetical protein